MQRRKEILARFMVTGKTTMSIRDAKLNRDLNLALLPLSATGPGGAAKFTQRLQKLKALKLGK